jgi:hypothetical protein
MGASRIFWSFIGGKGNYPYYLSLFPIPVSLRDWRDFNGSSCGVVWGMKLNFT